MSAYVLRCSRCQAILFADIRRAECAACLSGETTSEKISRATRAARALRETEEGVAALMEEAGSLMDAVFGR